MKRNERIGADAGRVWARELRLGNPYAKSVLLAIANYMNENGAAWPGVATISRDTDISENTVAKRLRWLQEIGAVALFKCWCDDNGQRNYEGRGRPTANEIRFLFNADRPAIEAAASASVEVQPLRGAAKETAAEVSPRPAGGLGDEVSPRPAGPPDESQHLTSTSLAPQQPPTGRSDSIDEEELEQEEEESPHIPPEGGDEQIIDDESEGSFSPFVAAYPEQTITNYPLARSIFAALTAQEQADAILGAKGYADLIRKERAEGRNRSIKDAHSWLRGRQWMGYLAAGKKTEAVAKRFDAAEGSDEWQAWTVFYRCCGKRGIPEQAIVTRDGRTIASIPSQWPPVGRGLDPDDRKWVRFVEGTPQFAAWLRTLKKIDVSIGLPTVVIEGKYYRSLKVPCEWPPRKDATGPSTSPLMDADDEAVELK